MRLNTIRLTVGAIAVRMLIIELQRAQAQKGKE